MDLLATWRTLDLPTSSGSWAATPVGPNARVARTASDGAALLVRISGEPSRPTSGLRTRHVEYAPSRDLIVKSGEREERATFAVLECEGDDTDLVQHFLRLVATLPLDADETTVDFHDAVTRMFVLFRSLSKRARGTPQGIWAETFLVAHSRVPDYLVQAWHSDPHDLHDFSGDGYRLEVKSTSRRLREHDFSLEQLERAPEKTHVASVMVTPDDRGDSVFDLLQRLSERVAQPELRRRAEVVVAEALGEDWREARDLRFDAGSARASFALFRALDIPRVPQPLPPTVRDVRFRADLSAVSPCEAGEHAVAQALLPLSERP